MARTASSVTSRETQHPQVKFVEVAESHPQVEGVTGAEVKGLLENLELAQLHLRL